MRISNAIRTIEDTTIKATKAIKPKASWLARKTAMTACAAVIVPVMTIANMAVAGATAVVDGTSASVKAIREV